jgi:hypothetical protein
MTSRERRRRRELDRAMWRSPEPDWGTVAVWTIIFGVGAALWLIAAFGCGRVMGQW